MILNSAEKDAVEVVLWVAGWGMFEFDSFGFDADEGLRGTLVVELVVLLVVADDLLAVIGTPRRRQHAS